jgi:hypothetical protein
MTDKYLFINLLFSFLLLNCDNVQNESTTNYKYPPRYIDDIAHDPHSDSSSFELCKSDNLTIQYFNNSLGLEYKGEKNAIYQAYNKNYISENVPKENGLVRIRFIVNCKGETGRFRIISMDEQYRENKIDTSITNQLLRITKNLEGWKPKKLDGELVDYYQYLIFKIQEGTITQILP